MVGTDNEKGPLDLVPTDELIREVALTARVEPGTALVREHSLVAARQISSRRQRLCQEPKAFRGATRDASQGAQHGDRLFVQLEGDKDPAQVDSCLDRVGLGPNGSPQSVHGLGCAIDTDQVTKGFGTERIPSGVHARPQDLRRTKPRVRLERRVQKADRVSPHLPAGGAPSLCVQAKRLGRAVAGMQCRRGADGRQHPACQVPGAFEEPVGVDPLALLRQEGRSGPGCQQLHARREAFPTRADASDQHLLHSRSIGNHIDGNLRRAVQDPVRTPPDQIGVQVPDVIRARARAARLPPCGLRAAPRRRRPPRSALRPRSRSRSAGPPRGGRPRASRPASRDRRADEQ